MSSYVPTKQHLRDVLFHYFITKKTAEEAYRLLLDIYGEKHAPTEKSCIDWFQRFKTEGYDAVDKERKKCQDEELE